MGLNANNELPAGFACLAIDTSTQQGSVAACSGERICKLDLSAGLQSRQIYTAVRDVLEELDIELDALDCIALGIGPGAFTGLRVAAAAAQALSYGAGKPVVKVSSLAAMALGAKRKFGEGDVVACLDARMGEAYLGHYQSSSGSVMTEDLLIDPQTYQLPEGLKFYAVGSGWAAYESLSSRYQPSMIAMDFEMVPAAADMLTIAAHDFQAGKLVSPEQALPNYVRDKVTY
ncbi:MAG: tRNA (adenosine(37)-N6)-threonylcarbamoyltransferase complex dimerization subunit type 1 TsaB [Gammaproteobacteria bacterium]|nr:tRNA (adenosine(37)-N6)-threonylcarbamoyltransferase complex dimerization subunit type 1 TsaB [Gammaproteobacteria bacterium]